ncbi:MAG: FkbM family methyltransferase [Gemmatimonadaceae bacterium]
MRSQPSGFRHFVFYWLTRWPRLYLFVEAKRLRGNWDKRIYLSFVRRGGTILDIGANFGSHTIFLSHLAGQRGRVLAFEPVSASFDALREIVAKRARFSNVQLFNVAIGAPGSADETAVVSIPRGDFGQASLRMQTASSWESNPEIERFPVSITRLDAEEAVQKLDRIDFVKIDIEGGELDALKGARHTLERHLPLLYCEIYERWAASFGYTPGDLLEFVRTLGYTEARVLSKLKVHPLRLGDSIPPGWFDTSSDVLFFTRRDLPLVQTFDRRFHRWIIRPGTDMAGAR